MRGRRQVGQGYESGEVGESGSAWEDGDSVLAELTLLMPCREMDIGLGARGCFPPCAPVTGEGTVGVGE
jgi:hypothetical protein